MFPSPTEDGPRIKRILISYSPRNNQIRIPIFLSSSRSRHPSLFIHARFSIYSPGIDSCRDVEERNLDLFVPPLPPPPSETSFILRPVFNSYSSFSNDDPVFSPPFSFSSLSPPFFFNDSRVELCCIRINKELFRTSGVLDDVTIEFDRRRAAFQERRKIFFEQLDFLDES